jgi:peptidoglycan/LPS O-acetylase OafA/YrhL/poly(3-hydroxybutyrate) depolymerase
MQTGLTGRGTLCVEDRLSGVDVLRGLAAMLVVLHHIDIRFRINGYGVEPFLPEGLRQLLLGTGQYAVTCFFVISGFLITRLSSRRWATLQEISLAKFYGLRAARILPLLLLVVAASALLHIFEVQPFIIRPDRASLGQAVFAALGFHLNWYEGRHGYLPGNWDVIWSLSVEETFYLLFPLVCLTVRKPVAFFFVLAPVIAVAPFNRVWLAGIQPWDNYSYLSCFDGIAFGCIAGYLSDRRPLDRSHGRIALLAGIAAVLFVLTFRRTTRALGLIETGTDFTVLAIGMALWLFALGSGVGNLSFARRTGVLRVVGRCSYEIYLTHMFVVYAFFLAFRALFGTVVPLQAVYPASYVLVLIASVLLGHFVSRCFSEPLNRAIRARFGMRKTLDARPSFGVGSTVGGIAVVALAMLLARPAHAQDVVDGFNARTLKTQGGTSLPYRLFVPDSASHADRLAIVVYLHGSGGAGGDNLKQIAGGNAAGTHLWVQPALQARYPVFVLAPQLPEGASWSSPGADLSPYGAKVIELVSDLASEYPIDRNRVYLVGQSLGGTGVWDLIAKRPDFFAAGVPLAGAGDPRRIVAAREVPVWAFHGAKDRTIPVARSQEMVIALKAAGGSVNYIEYADADHAVWERAFSEPGLPEWLFSQKRLPVTAN